MNAVSRKSRSFIVERRGVVGWVAARRLRGRATKWPEERLDYATTVLAWRYRQQSSSSKLAMFRFEGGNVDFYRRGARRDRRALRDDIPAMMSRPTVARF